MTEKRLVAAASLALGAGAIVLAVALALSNFPHGLLVLALLWAALAAGWEALRALGGWRWIWVVLAVLAAALCVATIVREGQPLWNLVVLAAFLLAVALARVAFRRRLELPVAPRPQHPVLFFNPRSGGGKATRFNLPEEARSRGIDPVELVPGEDLRDLVRRALAAGADALAMAGGDGSQAIVAELAAESGVPYSCIPAGTRNHFALDLGVDRDDVVGSLDALVSGGERRVDLAEVNGRVFVNNVSLGLYADAVQRSGYRDAKLRTLLDLAPDELGAEGAATRLHWRAEGGEGEVGTFALLVSNNEYRLATAIGSGTRPRLDEGLLGVAALSSEGGSALSPVGLSWRQWRCRDFEVEADGPVPAGIDGEAAVLDSPVRFRSRPRALRVRIAPGHPGASPSTAVPRGLPASVSKLARIAIGDRSVS